MDWKTYAGAVLLFSLVGFIFLYLLQRLQGLLPLNPAGMGAVSPDSALNTAVSFVTNTNWQGYGGETTMSYLTQMLGLTVQNFVSAAAGMAILVAFIRGLTRHNTRNLGNFWVDMTRSTLYILLPLSIILALVLVSQGVVQTLSPYATANLVQPQTGQNDQTVLTQTIAVGPAASQIAIKQLGNQRRRVLQHQLGAPFRKPHPALGFPGNAVDLADPRRAVLYLWRNGGRYPPGMGHSDRHVGPVWCAGWGCRLGRTEWQPAAHPAGSRPDRQRTSNRGAIWKAKNCALAR